MAEHAKLTAPHARAHLQNLIRCVERQGEAIRLLLTPVDEAAQHISELGCTCGDRSAHRSPCTGHDIAREYWHLTNRIRRRAGVQEKERTP